MFDLENESEERRRENWYSPLGEYIVLFSNLELSSNEWIDLVTDSKAVANHIKNLTFRKRVELILNLIGEYQVSEKVKNKWKSLWKKAIELSNTRNLIAHNPPFENFKIYLDRENIKVAIESNQEEIHKLNKPIGEPGSGLTIEKIKRDCVELRSIILELDKEHTSESLRY